MSTEIRPINPAQDIGAVKELLVPEFGRYPELKPDVSRTYQTLKHLCTGRHYARLVEHDGEPVGCLLAVVNDNPWAQRANAAVMAWVARRPGTGMVILNDFVQWVRERRVIRVAGFNIDCPVDGRLPRIMERFGFQQRAGAILLVN